VPCRSAGNFERNFSMSYAALWFGMAVLA
jgi:hypothetical protein